jgi:hypothetical protein
MSPESSRLRLGMMRPERIADVCRQVHTCFADGSDTLVPLWHTVALMTLHRFDRLPPHRQSLAVIAGNIAGALDRLGAVDRRLEGIADTWRFGQTASGELYDPHQIRQAVQLVTSLRPFEPRAFMQGVASYVLGVELAKRGLPQSMPLLAYRVLQPPPWTSFLEAGGLESSLLWNMTALLETFSPPGPSALRFTVADCDRRQEALVRMLAAIWESTTPIALVGTLPGCSRSPLRFDRIIAIADTASDGYLQACTTLLHEGGKALIAIPTAHLERWWLDQLHAAIAADRIEAIVEWTPTGASAVGWTFLVVRTVAPVHLRRRYAHGRLIGTFGFEQIEELADALTRGGTEATWLQCKSSHRVLEAARREQDSTSFAALLERYAERGLDVGVLSIGTNGTLRFDERITSPQMLRTAIRSAQSLRGQEMRFYYTLHLWWMRIRPLLRSYGRMVWPTVEQSLVEHLSSVPSMTLPQARSLGVRWWHSVEPDVAGVERYGERAVVESIIGSIERKVRTVGVKLWHQLDGRERYLLARCVPALYQRAIGDLERQQHERQAELAELDTRIAELKEQIAAYRAQMADLHARAKAHDVPHDAPELIDSTLPLQNELSELLKAMVASQSELKMLQNSRALIEQPSQRDWFSPVVARCTAQLMPALQSVRRSLDQRSAWALLEELWEEELRAEAEHLWESLVEEVYRELERVWKRMAGEVAHDAALRAAVRAQ